MKIDLQLVREFNRIDLMAKQLVEGFITGLHKSPYHGFSVEFAEHRLYNTGESTKNIDWKVKVQRILTGKCMHALTGFLPSAMKKRPIYGAIY
jgi:hypothetical protein